MNRSPLHWLTSDISQWDPDICHKISWKTSQASRLYSLATEVDQPGICGDIWNHHSVSSIVHILWAAKCTHHKKGQMVCCWKGMENLQCGSQNHHVCHIAWLKAYLHYLWLEIKVVCQVIWFVSFLNSQLGWIYLFEIIQKLLVIKNN